MDTQMEWIQMILLPGGFFVTFFGVFDADEDFNHVQHMYQLRHNT